MPFNRTLNLTETWLNKTQGLDQGEEELCTVELKDKELLQLPGTNEPAPCLPSGFSVHQSIPLHDTASWGIRTLLDVVNEIVRGRRSAWYRVIVGGRSLSRVYMIKFN